MRQIIELYFFVLSVIFCLKFVVQFVITLGQEEPELIKINAFEKPLLYLAFAYIITSIINIIFL